MKKMTLRFWILFLITSVMLSILGSALFSAYLVTKENVITQSLEINRVYSEKLAHMTDGVFLTMGRQLEVRGKDIIEELDNKQALSDSLDQLLWSTKNFNVVAVIDKEGTMLASSPDIGLNDKFVYTTGVIEALQKRETIISDPYLSSMTGKLIILISTPLWGPNGDYLGLLAGTIHLKEKNMLWDILGEHFAEDGSYVYVVDSIGNLIYHPDINRIGENVQINKVVQKVMAGQSGAQFVTNSKGVDMLAGYSYIPSSKWGIISQTPFQVAVAPVLDIIQKMLLYAFPFVILFFVMTIILSKKLAYPLRKLALYTMNYNVQKENHLKPNIPRWYFEADQLAKTFDEYFQKQKEDRNTYKKQSLTDALTGLSNRRRVEDTLTKWKEEKECFSLILLDADHFKHVNDTYGHDLGDDVLRFIASNMLEVSREDDICARFGGEEFVLLLPDTNEQKAFEIAERLRLKISSVRSPVGEMITISSGVGIYRDKTEDIRSFFKRVDHALYQAKKEGRNKTIVSHQSTS